MLKPGFNITLYTVFSSPLPRSPLRKNWSKSQKFTGPAAARLNPAEVDCLQRAHCVVTKPCVSREASEEGGRRGERERRIN